MRAPIALAFLVAAGCVGEPDPPCVAAAVYAQLFAVAGYSVVEAPPAVPQQVTLAPNRALVDADVVTSAGVDLGYSRTVAGDAAFRDVAVELASGQPPLSEIWIWVDRALPPEVSTAYAWTAFRSDDNATWTAIPSAGSVRFGTIDLRFEIPLAPTQARYVKVVTRPLAAGVTADPRFADVLVTEAQGFSYSGGCP